ncbi:MAG: DUF5666 domain-containing protein [Patescibacteria group bacterium]
MKLKKVLFYSFFIALTAGTLALAAPTFAATKGSDNATNQKALMGRGEFRGRMMVGNRSGVVGTVATISGTTLTVNGRQSFGTSTASVVYTIDGANATVVKNNATSTFSSITVGDTIFVQGTISGTSVTATSICDGMKGGPKGENPGEKRGHNSSSTPPIQGNGQPVIAGTISAVSGSALTVSAKSGIQYSVDATTAKIVKGQTVITVSNIAVGDPVVVQGATNGTSVVASSIIDQARPVTAGTAAGNKSPVHSGIFGQIGGFFKHLFGF